MKAVKRYDKENLGHFLQRFRKAVNHSQVKRYGNRREYLKPSETRSRKRQKKEHNDRIKKAKKKERESKSKFRKRRFWR